MDKYCYEGILNAIANILSAVAILIEMIVLWYLFHRTYPYRTTEFLSVTRKTFGVRHINGVRLEYEEKELIRGYWKEFQNIVNEFKNDTLKTETHTIIILNILEKMGISKRDEKVKQIIAYANGRLSSKEAVTFSGKLFDYDYDITVQYSGEKTNRIILYNQQYNKTDATKNDKTKLEKHYFKVVLKRTDKR